MAARSRAAPAAYPALAACAALAAWAALAACAAPKTDDSPEGVVRQLYESTAKRDTKEIFRLLGPKTRARLTDAATRATQATGGKHKYQAHEMLSAFFRPSGTKDWTLPPGRKGFKLIHKNSTTARVEVRGLKKSQRVVVTLVWVDRKWRIEFERTAPKQAAPSKAVRR
ncbi:MAG: hypothetical protein ABI333_23995 [bacterium]